MKYFSAFSGIGGFEVGIGDKGECVGFSEINKPSIAVYKHHFLKHENFGDITKIITAELPDFSLLVGGFPCQSFSIAGKRGGFQDTRGTLFFEIARIAKDKRPSYLLLENVKGLLNHDKGNTFATIISTLDELGYDCQWSVLNSKYYGVPQNRNRVYIAGYLRGKSRPKIFNPLKKLQEINEKDKSKVCTSVPTESFHHWTGDGNIIASTLTASGSGHWAKCGSNVVADTLMGQIHRIPDRMLGANIIEQQKQIFRNLTPTECEKLQGFEPGWTEFGHFEKGDRVWNGEIKINKANQREPVLIKAPKDGKYPMLDSQRYAMCGNAVTTLVVKHIINNLMDL